MNLLLLLSALLSALTGLGGARGEAARPAVCACAAEVRAVRNVAQAVATRPVQALPHLASLPAVRVTALALTPDAPFYASRRRE